MNLREPETSTTRFAAWREILEYARWSPSPHNTQHWKVRLVDDRRAVLLFDPARLLPVTDERGRFMTCGLGIFLETMSIAAAPLCLEVRTSPRGVPVDASAVHPMPFADLELVERTTPEPLDRELIRERRTSRLPYHDRPVAPDVLEDLSRVATRYDHRLEYSSDPREVAWVVDLNADTMFDDLRDNATRGEIGRWARYSLEDARRRRDGLAAFAMLFPGWLMRLFFEHNWVFHLPGLDRVAKAFYKRSMRGTRTVAWISGKFEEQADCLATGRMFARLWLTMTKHGVYLHPFGSVITNPRAHRRMKEHFASPERRDPLWMLVRLGYGEVPPRAHRLSVEDLLVP